MRFTTRGLSPTTRATIEKRIAGTRPERERVRRLVEEHRAADAEDTEERRVRWAARVTDEPRAVAKQILDGDRSVLQRIDAPRRAAAEAIQGGTVDFVPAWFLDVGAVTKRAVARVTDRHGNALGTGFLISPALFLTNQHVLHDPAEAETAFIEFDYEALDMRRARPVSRFGLDPKTVSLFSDEDLLDYALIAVGSRVAGAGRLGSFGYCPLSDRENKHAKAICVNVVQHPDGRPKELSLRENRITARDDRVLLYQADTLPGSSGSPVFNDFWEVIALHHYGEPSAPTVASGTAGDGDAVNEGIRISAIVKDLVVQAQAAGGSVAELVREALSLDRERNPHEADERAEPELERDTVEKSSASDDAISDAWTAKRGEPTLVGRIELPLEIYVRVGGAAASTTLLKPAAPLPSVTHPDSAAEKIEIDPEYSNRRGYASNFLGVDVPLPKLTRGKTLIAPLLQPGAGGAAGELRYQHFSILMNKKRRIAFFTAVNIDGDHWINIDRATGLPKPGAEARETWWQDPRLAAGHQLDQPFFDDTSVYFDRGHLVRRQDPSWGDNRKAVRANADSYHFTNCSPQNWLFNQSITYWQGVETYLLEHGAVGDQERISVFSGPIFEAGDPSFKGLQVPVRFWKVAFRVKSGALAASGFVVDQTDILRKKRSGSETASLATVEKKVKEWRYRVSEIESLTDLDFGPLTAADTFKPGSEGAESAKRRPLTGWADLD